MPNPVFAESAPEWVSFAGCTVTPGDQNRECSVCGHCWSEDDTPYFEERIEPTMELLYGPRLWDHLTDVAKKAGPRRAAIAFVGEAAPELLKKFGPRDILVVNAGDHALAAGATSPAALAAFLDRGVQLYSYSALHAKVIATKRSAVVGSSNASTTSNRSDEAAILTDDPAIIAGVRGMVTDLAANAERIDGKFVARARKLVKESGPRPPVPGITETEAFPPRPVTRLHFVEAEHDEWPDDVEEAARDLQSDTRRSIGRVRRQWWDPTPRRSRYRVGDVLIEFAGSGDDDYAFEAPALIVGKAKVPTSGLGHVFVLQSLRDAPEAYLSELHDDLAEIGVVRAHDSLADCAEALHGARVTDSAVADRVLDLWRYPPMTDRDPAQPAPGDRVRAHLWNFDGRHNDIEAGVSPPDVDDPRREVIGELICETVDSAFGVYERHIVIEDNGRITYVEPSTIRPT